MVGTPIYMAPEQMEGREVDARSDIYSLGILMYELATGKPPFDSDTVVGLLAQHKYSPPVAIRERVTGKGCPAALEEIVLRCLEKHPDHRYQSGTDVAEALNEIKF